MKNYSSTKDIRKALNCTHYQATQLFREAKEISEKEGIKNWKSQVFNGSLNKALGTDQFKVEE